MADLDKCEGCEALERRVALLELAVAALGNRQDETPAGPVKTIFGIPVYLAPDVDADRIRAAVADLPPGLSGDDVVDRLAEDRLLVRQKARR